MTEMPPPDPYRAPPPPAPYMQVWQGPAMMSDRREPNGAVVAIAWVIAVCTLGYMLPWAIAATRGKSNQPAIALVNFFLGWSIIGWIVALVMACQAHQVIGHSGPTVVMAQPTASLPGNGFNRPATAGPGPGWYPALAGAGQQYWDGAAWTDHRAP